MRSRSAIRCGASQSPSARPITNPGETGQIFWAEHLEWRRRPAVARTRDEAIALNEVFVVLATITIRNLPTKVRRRDAAGVRPHLDHEDTVAKSFTGERMTTLSAEKRHTVCRALDVATRCG